MYSLPTLRADVSGLCGSVDEQGHVVQTVPAATAPGAAAQPGCARPARSHAEDAAAQAHCHGHRSGRSVHSWQSTGGEGTSFGHAVLSSVRLYMGRLCSS